MIRINQACYIDGTGLALGPITINQGAITALAPILNLTTTWNNSGVTFAGFKYVITDTASAAGSLPFQILGGAAGTTNCFSVGKTGATSQASTANAANFSTNLGGGLFYWNGRSVLRSNSDGEVQIGNNANTGWTTFNLGPTTGNTANGTWQFSKVNLACVIGTDTNCTGKGTGTITTATTALPAGAIVYGVSARVITILAGSDGIVSWALGHAGDTDKWGAALDIAATTTSAGANFTDGSALVVGAAAAGVTFSGTGGKIIDSGAITITVYYMNFIPISV
jgi:hypothetical protein